MSFHGQQPKDDSKSPLIHLIRRAVTNALNGSGESWKMVIMDRKSQELILSVMTKNDIINLMVQDIELIDGPPRGVYPNVKAVYFLEPTRENVDRVIGDFSMSQAPQGGAANGRGGKAGKSAGPSNGAPSGPSRRYAKAALFWIDALPEQLFDRLTKSPAINYLDQCIDLTINFWPPEGRVFTYRNFKALPILFGPPETDAKTAVERWEWELDYASKTILNVLVTISEDPHIRYYNPPGHHPLGAGLSVGEHTSKRLAAKLARDMEAYKSLNPSFKPDEVSQNREKGVIFIVDRTVDPVAPFLHEITYQAMCNDLLPIKDGRVFKYSFTNQQGVREDKEANLTDEDETWAMLRHLRMDEVATILPRKAKEIMPADQGQGKPTINDLRDQLANLPETQKARDQVSLHLTMAEQCMEMWNQRGLIHTSELEQICATGMTKEGGNPKSLVEQMVPRLADPTVSTRDKVRIIALYILLRDGVPEEDKKRLYQHARLSMHEQDAINNLTHLGVNVSKEKYGKRRQLFKQDTSHYRPVIKAMLEDHFAGKLDDKAFPYFGSGPAGAAGSLRKGAPPPQATNSSLRSSRPNWTKGRALATTAPKQRVVVFVAGGVTYSEIRAVHEIGAALNKDIFVGSTHVNVPEGFIHELSMLDRGGRAAELAPPNARYEAPSKPIPLSPSRILGAGAQTAPSSQKQPPPSSGPPRGATSPGEIPPPADYHQQQQQHQHRPHAPTMNHGYSQPVPSSGPGGGGAYGGGGYANPGINHQSPQPGMLSPQPGRPGYHSAHTSPPSSSAGFRPSSAASNHSALQPQRFSASSGSVLTGGAQDAPKLKEKKSFFKRF